LTSAQTAAYSFFGMGVGTLEIGTRVALTYFNWKDNRFALVRFIIVDPLKDLP